MPGRSLATSRWWRGRCRGTRPGGQGLPAPNSVSSARYYSDIRQSSPASYQEMNSALAELSGVRHGPGDTRLHICVGAEGRGGAWALRSRLGPHLCTVGPQNYTSAPHCLEALQELYNHIHRYYDQVRPAVLQGGGAHPQSPEGGPRDLGGGVWDGRRYPGPTGGGEGGPMLGKRRDFNPDSSGRHGAAPAGSGSFC